jgi:hypothetical protein
MPTRLALALVLVAAAFAQEPAPETDPNVLLSLAFRKLQSAENVVAAVDVVHAPPEQQGVMQGGAGGGMIIMETRVAGQEKPFEGRVEACRAADGAVVVVSEAELPGFSLYVREGRAVERTTFEEDRFSLEQLRAELVALLDPKALAQRVFDGKLEPRVDEATGDVTFHGKVAREIVPPADGPMAFMQGRVLDAEATLVVGKDGRLRTAKVKITRSDPMREMMRGDFRRIAAGRGVPGGALPPADDDKKHDIPGGSTTYNLEFRDARMPARAQAFKTEVERLLEAPDQGNPPAGGETDEPEAPENER